MVNTDLYDKILTRQINTLRVAEGQRQQLAVIINRLRKKLRTIIIENYTKKSQKALFTKLNSTIKEYYVQIAKLIKANMYEYSLADYSTLQKTYKDITKSKSSLTKEQAKDIADGLILGASLIDWLNSQSVNLQFRTTTTVNLLSSQDKPVDDFINGIIGTKTDKKEQADDKIIPVYFGGLVGQSQRELNTIASTALLGVAGTVNSLFQGNNKEVLNAVQHVSILDNRTTDLCISLDGGIWDVETGKPLPESASDEDWIPVPCHLQCRSVDIFFDYEELNNVQGTREDMFGNSYPLDLTYEQWLSMQSKEFQLSTLGKTKYSLWKDKKLSFADMIDVKGNPLKISELLEL